jgi:hypothetical protein
VIARLYQDFRIPSHRSEKDDVQGVCNIIGFFWRMDRNTVRATDVDEQGDLDSGWAAKQGGY